MPDLFEIGSRTQIPGPCGIGVLSGSGESGGHRAFGTAARIACIVLFATTLPAVPVSAQEPYRYYGGDVEAKEKNPAIEACEYEELVEKQRCNRSLNKNSCIDGIRRECYERFRTDKTPETPPEPRR